MDNFLMSLMLTVIGMGVVFLALLVLMLSIQFIGLIAGDRHRPAPAGGGRMTVNPAGAGEEEEMAAAISAAISTVYGETARVHYIRMLHEEDQATWSRLGRIDIMRSHTTGDKR